MKNKHIETNAGLLGKIVLVYEEAVRSGTNEYIPITMLLVMDKEGTLHNVRPRDLKKIFNDKVRRQKK